jgi:hypothetical protein
VGITTKGRVEYYLKAFGSLALPFVEFIHKTGSANERLDAIAQVIAECNLKGQAPFWSTNLLWLITH